jgi:hypothetical protein
MVDKTIKGLISRGEKLETRYDKHPGFGEDCVA